MNTVFIYALNCPITGRTRYVGKTKHPATRIKQHLRAKRESNHRACWIRSLLTGGRIPVLEILDEVSEVDWPSWEVAWIEFFRESGCDLTNSTIGGEGVIGHEVSLETREKQRISHLGKKQSPEVIAKRVAQCSGEKHYRFGKSPSPETCAKISATLTGRKLPLEQVAQMRLRKPSEDTREKHRVAALGNTYSKGYKHSPETLVKRSAATKEVWRRRKEAAAQSKQEGL